MVTCFHNFFRSNIGKHGNQQRKFWFYCIYAFGMPCLLTGIVYALDNFDYIAEKYRPMMGHSRCWLQHSRLVEAIYIYAPLTLLMLLNLVFFSMTACKICMLARETSVLRGCESNVHSRSEADNDRLIN